MPGGETRTYRVEQGFNRLITPEEVDALLGQDMKGIFPSGAFPDWAEVTRPEEDATMVETLTEPQLLAIVIALVDAKPARRALEVALGAGQVPDLKDFNTRDGEEIAKWENLLYLLETAGEKLRGEFRGREQQTTTLEPAAAG
jgi:hypothetical protein